MTIRAVCDWRLYENDGFVIARYKAEDGNDNMPKGSLFTAKGYDLPTGRNVVAVMEGSWAQDQKHGKDGKVFVVRTVEVEPVDTKNGFIDYMSSLHTGIGPKTAERVWDRFGQASWDICDNQPEQLLNVRGVTQNTLGKLHTAIAKTRVVKEVLDMYRDCPRDVTPERAQAIYRKFGRDTIDVLTKNTYALCEIRGLSFESVDTIAKATPGWRADAEGRLLAGVQCVFRAAEAYGHTCVPKAAALQQLIKLLHVEMETARRAFNLAHRRGECVVRGDFAYSSNSFACENGIAENALRLLRGNAAIHAEEEKLDSLLTRFEQENGFELAPEQKKAVKNCFNNNMSIITGGPGTGKSTIIKAVLYVLKGVKEGEPNILLMAPTGRAARRMQETTGHSSSTIHSALKIHFNDDGSASMPDPTPLDADMVIVDEVSMVDQYLANQLLSRIGDKTVVVLVGDSDQLPSVNAGNVLHELISSEQIPCTRLQVIFRQAQGDPIIINAGKILHGDTQLTLTKTFRAFHGSDNRKLFDYACWCYLKGVAKFGLDNVVLLAPFKRKGTVCVDTLNKAICDMVNPLQPGMLTVDSNGRTYKKGDKIMQTKNTEIASNGDIGIIEDITVEDVTSPDDPWAKKKDTVCRIKFEGQTETVTYRKSDLDQVDHAYAMSIHKSQGSEYKAVIIVMTNEHMIMAKRNLLYTGVTRGKKNVLLIGNAETFNHAICDNKVDVRYTQLAEILRELSLSKSA